MTDTPTGEVETPQCDRLAEARPKSEVISDFLEWLKYDASVVLCRDDGHRGPLKLEPVRDLLVEMDSLREEAEILSREVTRRNKQLEPSADGPVIRETVLVACGSHEQAREVLDAWVRFRGALKPHEAQAAVDRLRALAMGHLRYDPREDIETVARAIWGPPADQSASDLVAHLKSMQATSLTVADKLAQLVAAMDEGEGWTPQAVAEAEAAGMADRVEELEAERLAILRKLGCATTLDGVDQETILTEIERRDVMVRRANETARRRGGERDRLRAQLDAALRVCSAEDPPDDHRRVLAWDGKEWAVWRYYVADAGPNKIPAEWRRELSDETHDEPQPSSWTELPGRP